MSVARFIAMAISHEEHEAIRYLAKNLFIASSVEKDAREEYFMRHYSGSLSEFCLKRLSWKFDATSTWMFDPIQTECIFDCFNGGTFGKIFHARITTDQHRKPITVVCKQGILHWLSSCSSLREVVILQRLHGLEHVPRLISLRIKDDHLDLFLTRGFGSLHDVIYIPISDFTKKSIYYWMWRLCTTLMHAHELRVYHCDIKPANIVLMRKQNFEETEEQEEQEEQKQEERQEKRQKLRKTQQQDEIMLIDWGSGVIAEEQQLEQTDFLIEKAHFGLTTIEYRSPEAWRKKRGTPLACCDVWSVACVFYELLKKEPLFSYASHDNATVHHFELAFRRSLDKRKLLDAKDMQVANLMLQENPRERCGLFQAAKFFHELFLQE